MSSDPLPRSVNIRKAVTRNACYEGCLTAEELPQFAANLRVENGPLRLRVEFAEDDEGQQYAAVAMRAPVTLECQRCLGPLQLELESDSRLALIHTDEQARQLPEHYEPLIAVEEVDLWAIAAEELALAMPVVAYHDVDECPVRTSEIGADEDQDKTVAAKDSPFNVLSSLLDSGDSKEK
jgi:uncharacterized protein